MRKLTLPLVTAMACMLVATEKQQRLAAGELDPSHVAADAKWVLHLDLEEILSTKAVEEARESRPQLTQYIRNWISEQYGIDPRTDLHAVTMFSRSYHSHTGTVILHADYDREKVEADIRKKQNLETKQWNDHTLYTVTLAKHRENRPDAAAKEGDGHDRSGGKQMTIVLVDDQTVVFASSFKNAQETLSLLAGDTESLKGTDSKLLSGDWKNAMAYGAAIDLQEVDQSNAPMPVLKQQERITWTLQKKGDKVSKDIHLVALSDDVAKEMEQVAKGVVAYEKLWAADSKRLREIVEATEISRDGKEVKVQWEAEGEQVVAALDELMSRYSEWRPLMGKRAFGK